MKSAIAQPQMTFGGEDLYPSVSEKAAALGFAIVKNHPFVDGISEPRMPRWKLFLMLNGFEIRASVDEQENIMLALAAGEINRESFSDWVQQHVVTLGSD